MYNELIKWMNKGKNHECNEIWKKKLSIGNYIVKRRKTYFSSHKIKRNEICNWKKNRSEDPREDPRWFYLYLIIFQTRVEQSNSFLVRFHLVRSWTTVWIPLYELTWRICPSINALHAVHKRWDVHYTRWTRNQTSAWIFTGRVAAAYQRMRNALYKVWRR
jgi:hypothetical protein